jgi:hypothetical protein
LVKEIFGDPRNFGGSDPVNMLKNSKILVTNFRRRIFYDNYPPHIVQYRNLMTPSPPKKFRRLLWTAPYVYGAKNFITQNFTYTLWVTLNTYKCVFEEYTWHFMIDNCTLSASEKSGLFCVKYTLYIYGAKNCLLHKMTPILYESH